MKCPACAQALSQIATGGVQLDVCQAGCGGVWFDNFELAKFDEAHEEAGPVLEANRSLGVSVKKTGRACPRCALPLRSRFSSVKRRVQVDECPGCAGIWLDADELDAIRSEFKTQADREQAADELFGELTEKAFAPRRAELEANRSKPRQFAAAMRWLTRTGPFPGQ